MGGAIAESLRGTGYDVTVTAGSAKTLERISKLSPGVTTTLSNAEAVIGADMILLAIKPYVLPKVADEIRDHIKPGAVIISVVAAVSIEDLDRMLAPAPKAAGIASEAERSETSDKLMVFRVIPNTAIRLGKSATFIASAPDVSVECIEEVKAIFKLSGKVFLVAEKDMGAVTALSSCGIAYFLRFIRAAAEGAVELGLRPGFAAEVAAATAEGAAALVEDGGHPEAEIDKVTTPGGLTIRGLNALEANGFTNAVIEALRASCKR